MPAVRVRDRLIAPDRAEAMAEREYAGMVRAGLAGSLDFVATQHQPAPPPRGGWLMQIA